MVTLINGELRKLTSLPTAWAGIVLGLLGAPAVVLINAPAVDSALADGTYGNTTDLAYQNLLIAVLGAIILGVVTVSSEYTSTGEDAPGARQLTATLLAAPRRTRLLIAKAAALCLLVAAQGVVTVAATLTLTEIAHGPAIPAPDPVRLVAAVGYLLLIGLLSYGLTLIVRNGIVTLTVLIVNSSVVSVSYLLTKVTPLAAYLPDIVGPHMFLRGFADQERIHPVIAGLVMTAWVAAFLALAARLFHRRDA